MPSTSHLNWQYDRSPRLDLIETQCQDVIASSTDVRLVDENLRAYTLLLSAHFQGFCRDLHTECAQVIASKVRGSLGPMVYVQFNANRTLDRSNPTMQNIREDFSRYSLNIDFVTHDPANEVRLSDLAYLNRWRNAAAHSGVSPVGPPLSMALLQKWRVACDVLTLSLDEIVYNHMNGILKRKPW